MFILFPLSPSGVGIVIPAAGCGIPVMEIARKDVPAGVPFLIVQDDALPGPVEDSASWVVDFSKPDGVAIGPQQWFINQAQSVIDAWMASTPPEEDEENWMKARDNVIQHQNNIIDKMKQEIAPNG